MLQSQMIPRATKTWLGRSVELDLDTGQALVGVEPGAPVSCRIGRYGERVPTGDSGRPGLGAERCGLLGDDGRGLFLDLECRDSNAHRYIERVDVLSDSSIAIVGDDKRLLLLSPEGGEHAVNDQSKGD